MIAAAIEQQTTNPVLLMQQVIVLARQGNRSEAERLLQQVMRVFPDHPAIEFARAMRETHPDLPLAFNYSSSFRWHKDGNPLTFRELGELFPWGPACRGGARESTFELRE